MGITETQYAKEQVLRGSIMQTSCQVEMVLGRINILANVDNLRDAIKTFKEKTLGNKVKYATTVIQSKYNNLYIKYEQAFKDLNSIVSFRNRFAHCLIEWDNESITSFMVIDTTATKTQVITEKYPYTLDEFISGLQKFTDVLFKMAELNDDIEVILKQNYPHLYPSLETES